jgi:hypothetical protein
MQIKFKETPEQIELIRAMGSKNPTVAREAMEAVAGYLTPVIKEVLLTAGSAARIFTDIPFDEDADQTIPLDLFYNEGAGYITVWSQSVAGGLPTSQVEGVKEMKFGTYRLDSAASWNKKYVRKSRLDVVSKAMERMLNEVVIKQERNAWSVVLKALAEASTRTQTSTLKHIIASATASTFTVGDLNALIIRQKRINESFSGNTAVQPYSNGPTDLFVSPEIKGMIRAFAYQPLMGATSVTSPTTSVTVLPDSVRNDAWGKGGLQSIFDITINELNELGVGQKYNTLFNEFTSGQSVPGTNGGAWDASADEILIGVDNTRGALLRPIERSEGGGTVNVEVDGQWEGHGSRVEKGGYYLWLTEGRLVIDSRVLSGIVS